MSDDNGESQREKATENMALLLALRYREAGHSQRAERLLTRVAERNPEHAETPLLVLALSHRLNESDLDRAARRAAAAARRAPLRPEGPLPLRTGTTAGRLAPERPVPPPPAPPGPAERTAAVVTADPDPAAPPPRMAPRKARPSPEKPVTPLKDRSDPAGGVYDWFSDTRRR